MTTDGGENWIVIDDTTKAFLDFDWLSTDTIFAVSYATSNYDAFCNVPESVCRSTDGGATWNTLYNFSSTDHPCDLTIADGVVFVLCKNRKIFKSTDLGETWESLSFSTSKRELLGNYYRIVMNSATEGFVFGRHIIRTTDEFQTYYQQDLDWRWSEITSSPHMFAIYFSCAVLPSGLSCGFMLQNGDLHSLSLKTYVNFMTSRNNGETWDNYGVTSKYMYDVQGTGDYTFIITAGDYIYRADGGYINGIQDLQINAADVHISPNPTSNTVNICHKPDIQTVSLYDLNGRLMKIFNMNDNNATLNLTPFQQGMYLLQVQSGDRTFIKKIVKQ